MSKQVGAMLKCPKCGAEKEAQLYRSLWIEDPKNREMVFKDKVNIFECAGCGFSERLAFSLLCTNKDKKFAIWYEPAPDPAVDKDIADYKKHMGPNSYFARAPRIEDWEEFKATIVDLETSRAKPNVKPSVEIKAAFDQFVGDPAKDGPAPERRRGLFVETLRNARRRWLVSLVPFLLVVSFLEIIGTRNTLSNHWNHLPAYVVGWCASTVGMFIVLTVLSGIIDNWRDSFLVRAFSFGTMFWGLGVFLSVVILDPFDYGNMGDDEFIHMFSIMFAPPVFIATATYVYRRYIR